MPPTMLIESLEAMRRKVKLLSVAFAAGRVAMAAVGLMRAAVLIGAVEASGGRVKRLGVGLGAGLVVMAAVGLMLAAILLDYVLNLPAGPRLVLALAAVGGLGYVVYRWVVKPILAKLTLSDVAGHIETAFPQFDDRLRSTVNFVRGQQVPGSDAMKQRVMTEAGNLAASLDLNRAIVMRPVWYSIAAGFGALLLAFLLATTINPLYRNIALARLFAPFGDAAWPKRVQIELTSPTPQRVPVGQRVDLRMRLTKGDRQSMKAVVYYQYGEGPWLQELMTRGADGTYAASLDAKVDANAARGAMNVRVTAGDDEMKLHPVTILPRLTVTRVEAVITPPAYVGAKEPTVVNLAAGPAIMPMGSNVALRLGFNKPLATDAKVVLKPVSEEMKLPAVEWKHGGEGEITGAFAAGESIRFHVNATDVDGFQNSGLEEYELVVRPDQQPTVQIEIPRRNEERTPVATVPVQAVAEDDYGIEAVKLVVDRLGDKKHWEIDLLAASKAANGVAWNRIEGSGDRQRFRANYAWELSQLADANLKPGDVLEYFLLAKDNFALNGAVHQPVPSGKLRDRKSVV